MSGELAPWLDLLTGAWQREHFEAQLSRAVRDSRRARTPLSLLWIDVDELSEHNDVHGRAVVDIALSHLVSQLGAVIDGRGPIGRMSGGAFAVMLSGLSRDRVLLLSEQLRRQAPKTVHSSAFGDFRLTISVGVAVLRSSEPWGNFLEAAESACTHAKQGGRDVVVAR